MEFPRVTLGRSGLRVSPIGLSAGYGINARGVERAFDHGMNYMYWGSVRRPGFGRGVRTVARKHRDELVVVVQTYSRSRLAMKPSLHAALRQLDIDYADVLLLGWWNSMPPNRILDGALTLREAGKVRHIMISCHNRPAFRSFIDEPLIDAIMVRYNAAHRGAEREVFPHMADARERPGVVAYTATRWGKLLDPALTPAGEKTPTAADCYRFALSQKNVDMCLCGPRNQVELDGALTALEKSATPMNDDELAWMQRVGDAVHAATQGDSMARRMWSRVIQRRQPSRHHDSAAG